jgi:uncharacterized protein (UPF0218 family)
LFKVRSYVLPDRLRTKLGRPLGDLLSGSNIDLGQVLRALIEKESPPKLILVGDSVSRGAAQAGVLPDVVIIDNLEKRRKATSYEYPSGRVVKVKNRAGMIEHQAYVAVQQAVRGEADRIEIDGEEDLLVLVAILAAPSGSIVVYGQPNEGVVLVRVSADTKAQAQKFLDQMDKVDVD